MPTRRPHKTDQMRRRPYVKSPQKLLRAVAAAFVPITPVQDLEKKLRRAATNCGRGEAVTQSPLPRRD
jgi:hypothetical protein